MTFNYLINYRFPLRLANKIITRGPAAKIRKSAPNWKKTSKFILCLSLKYYVFK